MTKPEKARSNKPLNRSARLAATFGPNQEVLSAMVITSPPFTTKLS